MRKKSNKIQFFALAFIMLFSVMNAWGLGLKTDILRLRQQGGNTTWDSKTKVMTWSTGYSNLWYVEPLSPQFEGEYKGKDLYEYSKIIVKVSNLSQGAELRLVIASELEGVTTEYYYPIKSNGTMEVPLHEEGWKNVNSPNAIVSLYDMLKYAKTVRIGGLTWEGSAKIEEMYLCKDLECDANGNITIGWEDLVANSDNLQRDGDFVKIDSGQKGWAGLGFSFDNPVAVETISVDGSLDAGYVDGEQGFINNFAINYDGRGTSYPGKAWNTSYVPDKNYKMTGFEVVFGSTGYGTGHVKSVSVKLKRLGVINFMQEGGQKQDQPSMNYYGIPLTLPMPQVQKANSTFLAWTTVDGQTIRGYAGDTFSPPYESMNVNAKWQSNTIGSHNTEENTTGCEMYKVPNNSMREFTFHNDGTGTVNANGTLDGTQNKNWQMWVTSNSTGLPNNLNGAYFFMDLLPQVKRHIQANDDFASETTVVYKKDGNNLNLIELTDWRGFMADMRAGTEVTVKVYNSNGKIRIYSVMKRGTNTYVYPYEYTKYPVNNSVDGDVYVSFTVNHAQLTNFKALASVPLAKLGFAIQGVDASNVMNHSDIANSSVEIRTPEGMLVPAGTMAGLGETYKYKANACSGWEFVKWTNGRTDNPRDAVISNDNIKEHHCSPVATFKFKSTSGFQIAKDRVYFMDFENVVNADVAPAQGQVALINESPADGVVQEHQKGRFYNYGNRGRIYTDPVFGRYYQNLAIDVNEFTESKSQNFLRIVLTDAQKEELKPIEKSGEATVGFWVNGRVANRYELPLERGSMFCAFSNDCFAIADNQYIHPRYMFDIACNGWTYSYMPNNDREEYANNPQAMNKFFYGEDVNVVEDNKTPKASLFGKYYTHSQDQRQHKFYDDNEWHYVTYVATDGLKKIKMYLDGELTGTLDVENDIKNEGDKEYKFFGTLGNYPGRVNFIRNFVLGGFTPHGLFFGQQYYSDAALAYDDISVYSKALTQTQIQTIINSKNYTTKPTEWHFTDAIKSYGNLTGWTADGSYYKCDKTLSNEELKSGSEVVFSTEGLRFNGASGKVLIDKKNGMIGLKYGAEIFIPQVPQYHNVYFVVKSQNPTSYAINEFDIAPVSNQGATFWTRGVSGYGSDKRSDMNLVVAHYYQNNSTPRGFVIYDYPGAGADATHDNPNNNNILWFSDIIVSPYCMVYAKKTTGLNTFGDVKNLAYVVAEQKADGTWVYKDPNNAVVGKPQLIIHDANGDKDATEDLARYKQGNPYGNPYIRFSSSAPRVAHVDQDGNVTLTGLAGYATIRAELIFGNIHDKCISTSYEIRVTKAPQTDRVASGATYAVGDEIEVKNSASTHSDSNISMTMGGWAYNSGKYTDIGGAEVTDTWSAGKSVQADVETIDGFNYWVESYQNAKNESYTRNDNSGNFVSVDQSKTLGYLNQSPWTLPCRGAYLKFEPKKVGVLSVYVLQNGDLDKAQPTDDFSTTVQWRPIYIADETGKLVENVRYGTNSRIFENDNFFKEGRRRAQFIEAEPGTYNRRLRDDLLTLKGSNYQRFRLLIDNWSNAGWRQKVIETEDGGYMVISKGLVRYSFNVYPGKTYYLFSNQTKIGYSGYNFEEGKILNEDKETYDTNPVKDATSGTAFTYTDGTTAPSIPAKGMDRYSVNYTRKFTANQWSSICLPFSMNHKKMVETFGEDTKVVLLKQIYPHGNNAGKNAGSIEFVYHINQDIIAGYPYLILPTQDVESIQMDAYFSGVTQPLFSVGSTGATLNYGTTSILSAPTGDNAEAKGSSTVAAYHADYPYVFEGCFGSVMLPNYSYALSSKGVLTRLVSDAKDVVLDFTKDWADKNISHTGSASSLYVTSIEGGVPTLSTTVSNSNSNYLAHILGYYKNSTYGLYYNAKVKIPVRAGKYKVVLGMSDYGGNIAVSNGTNVLATINSKGDKFAVNRANVVSKEITVNSDCVLEIYASENATNVYFPYIAVSEIKGSTIKPFRAYLRCMDPTNASKLTSMSFEDAEEGETSTSIDEMLQESGVILNSSDVYGIDGMAVRRDTHSLQGLSKGVYIVNGKKYVVK